MKTIKTFLMTAVAVASAFVAQARTIALWPMEYDSSLTTFDGSSAILPGDALSIYTDDTTVSGIATGVDWNLPPNLGTDKFLFDPVNRTAIFGTLGAPSDAKGMTMRCTSANVVSHLYPTNDFTLEGWFMMKEYKTDNWTIFLQQGMGSSHKSGWFVSITGLSTEGGRKFNINAASATVAFENLTSAEEVVFTNRWHHFALTCKWAYSDTASRWEMFLDGVSKGQIVRPRIAVTEVNNSRQVFEFGGRHDSKTNRFYGGFDYWRLSDEVLAPAQFLNAGGAGTVVPEAAHTTTTVAYWKLESAADGTMDASDSVGTADLSDGLYDLPATTANFFSGMVPSRESAFSGNPPNPTAALSSPNRGSVLAPKKTGNSASSVNGTVLVVPNLGSELSFANDFTVEGWIKPRWKTGTACSGYLFGTRFDSIGWVLGIRSSGELYVYAHDGANTLRNNDSLGTLPDGWLDRWTHLALVYSATDGNGTWTLYADGTLLGNTVNSRASTASNAAFRLGGRETWDSNFAGHYDCFRVSKAALVPGQFLCAANGTHAANVIAFWPLDTLDGVSWDLRDEQGNYTLRASRTTGYRPVADASSAPVVANPDTSANFNGCAASTRGSIAFCAADGATRTRAHLTTSDPKVMAAISSTSGFTIEGYFKRAAAATDVEYIFITQTGALSSSTWQQHQSGLYYSESTGFSIRDAKFSNFGNGVSGNFAGTGGLESGRWYHFALTYQGVESKNSNNQTVLTSTWKLYLDGVLAGTLSRPTLGAVDATNPRWLVFGSRPHSGNAFRGSLSSIRISNVALDSGQFLCDAGSVPAATPPETLAYWPLDSADGASFDLSAAVEPVGYSFYYYTASAVACSSDQALSHVPPHTGLPSSNAGSVTLADGHSDYMRAAFLGRRLSLDKDWTVEGWFKWSAATRGGRNVLAGTYDASTCTGWRLELDDTGDSPRFRVYARTGYLCSPLADTTFPGLGLATGNLTAWHHVALSYDPLAGCGTWTLRVDGREAGTAENLWRNDSLGTSDTFALGNYGDPLVNGFGGSYDLWRASKGFVATEDLIWLPSGMKVFIR